MQMLISRYLSGQAEKLLDEFETFLQAANQLGWDNRLISMQQKDFEGRFKKLVDDLELINNNSAKYFQARQSNYDKRKNLRYYKNIKKFESALESITAKYKDIIKKNDLLHKQVVDAKLLISSISISLSLAVRSSTSGVYGDDTIGPSDPKSAPKPPKK